ncbi:MAG: MFS transporter [Kiritimatiellales bacterium]
MSEKMATADVSGKAKHRSPWAFMPCLDFVYGIFNGFASQYVSLVFKTMGASNAIVGLTSLLQLPMGLKALWAPAEDRWGTYRSVMLTNLLVIAFMIGCMAGVFLLPFNTMAVIAGMFFLTILVITFFEVSYVGYRVSALTGSQIALFAGISSALFRLGLMFGNSVLIILVGKIQERTQSYNVAWAVVFGLVALSVAAIALYLKRILPYPASDSKNSSKLTPKSYLASYTSFFKQHRGAVILVYLFTCRLGEGMLNVIKNPFFLDPVEKGGLGMSLTDIGIMGPFVIIALIAAGIIGGIIVKTVGLSKCFFALGLLMFLPNACFSWLALYPKYEMVEFFGVTVNPWVLGSLVIEIIGYGLSFAAIVTFAALIAKNAGTNKATFGAITGSVNLLGFMLGGAFSGIVQEHVGYFWTFNITMLLSIPAWILILFLPVGEIMEKSAQLDAEAKGS